VTIKNAYVATGMGKTSRLIRIDGERFTSDAERDAFIKTQYRGSGNTFYYTNSDAGSAFQIGSNTYNLADWSTRTGESGGTTSATKYNTQPVYIVEGHD